MLVIVKLTHEEEIDLIQRWRATADKKALTRLIVSQTGYVIMAARKFYQHSDSLSMEDLVQEGHIGLLEGLKRFDLARDLRLGTYTTWWIRAYVQKAVLHAHRGGINALTTREARKVYYGLNKAKHKLGVDATPANLAAELGISEKQLTRHRTAVTAMDMSIDDLPSHVFDSITAQVEAGREDALIYQIDVAKKKHGLVALVSQLDERERAIIQRRHLTEPAATLKEIAETFDISRERVRQIETRALEKLRLAVSA